VAAGRKPSAARRFASRLKRGNRGRRRILTRSWAGHVTSRSVSGTPNVNFVLDRGRARAYDAPSFQIGLRLLGGSTQPPGSQDKLRAPRPCACARPPQPSDLFPVALDEPSLDEPLGVEHEPHGLVIGLGLYDCDRGVGRSLGARDLSTELLIASADGDGTDDSPERCPACFSGSVGYTRLRSFVRRPADVVEPVDLRSGYCLGCSPRGPPGNRANNPGLPESSWSKPAAIDAPIVGVFSSTATPHNTLFDPKDPGTPENPRTLYAGGGGVLMSTDGRATWRAPVPPPPTDTAPPESSG
jgi:hypothetical protein